MRSLIPFTVALLFGSCRGMDDKMAVCQLAGALQGDIMVHHMTNTSSLHFMGTVKNLTAGKHGFHVHENGALGNNCLDAGGHYNPNNQSHSSLISANRHVGDLGNIEAGLSGDAKVDITLKNAKLEDLLGKSIVVHSGEDDLGLGGQSDSLTTGHAGSRLDCCIIVLKKMDHGNMEAMSSTAKTTTSRIEYRSQNDGKSNSNNLYAGSYIVGVLVPLMTFVLLF